ncbi:NAD(P)/FAD-dependent oxidoreductase [Tepidimicrobium xylanilyticum]|uniref:Glycerol-3-phosphate dehydrogenase n=1 Tax=Tepidimicrobium xylanilyticum TaxID=1123352 RepID=A0A1H3BCY4_9FIRM|nr:NAD(P)/FAD-dependent oxidoreductase [Tepidimicrobium xylanilyticum]SDX38899.1 glycerol-3-phosphate dehydrogenase [Tepidimicrobium xylanilyticum]
MYDVVIVGAGITGTFIARELSRYELKILLIDKENDISNGTTKANTAIIHAGFDAPYNSKMGYFNVRGNPMFDKICKELDVPFKRIGSLVLAFNQEDLITIEKLFENGLKSKIPQMEILDGKQAKKIEPNISDDVKGALYARTAGIIGPWELAIALAENAMENGVELKLNTEVQDITKSNNGYKIVTNLGNIITKIIVNCAGIYADKLNNMVSDKKLNIIPKKGQYYLLDKMAGNLVNKVIFQCPTEKGKGVVVTPTVHGNLIVGPDSEIIEEREDTRTETLRLKYIKEVATRSVPNIPFEQVITTFAGVRAEPDTGDFIIEEVEDSPGFINVAGIKSPGLSASPAIAEYVVNLVGNIYGGLNESKNFNPYRKKVIRFAELSDEEKDRLIKENPKYGNIICRCETVTEGEILDAIHRKAGARTVDGIKRRARPGSGRCQGGFCLPRVMEILAREMNEEIEKTLKDGLGSYILTGKTK